MGNSCSSAPNNFAVNSFSIPLTCTSGVTSAPSNLSMSLMSPALCSNGQTFQFQNINGTFSVGNVLDPSSSQAQAFPIVDLDLEIDFIEFQVTPDTFSLHVPTQRSYSNISSDVTWSFPQNSLATPSQPLSLPQLTIDASNVELGLVFEQVRANVTYKDSDGNYAAAYGVQCQPSGPQPTVAITGVRS